MQGEWVGPARVDRFRKAATMTGEFVIKHLRSRADFWDQFPAHEEFAKKLHQELDLLIVSWVKAKRKSATPLQI